MTRIESLLLTLVVEAPCQLYLLLSERLAEIRNQALPLLTRDHIVPALMHLFTQGDIVAMQFAATAGQRFDPWGLSLQRVRDDVVPTRDELDAALHGRLAMSYKLTGTGGHRWETMVQADWTRYIDETYALDYPYRGEIIAGSNEMREQFLALALVLRYPSHSPIKAGTVVQDEIAPWQATYWKGLAKGYRALFSCPPTGQTVCHGEQLLPLVALRRWYSVPGEDEEPTEASS